MNVDKFCTKCKIKIDENFYKTDRTVCKNCCNTRKRKNEKKQSKNQYSIMLTIKKLFQRKKRMTTTPMFQQMKTLPLLLLVQEMLTKLITC